MNWMSALEPLLDENYIHSLSFEMFGEAKKMHSNESKNLDDKIIRYRNYLISFIEKMYWLANKCGTKHWACICDAIVCPILRTERYFEIYTSLWWQSRLTALISSKLKSHCKKKSLRISIFIIHKRRSGLLFFLFISKLLFSSFMCVVVWVSFENCLLKIVWCFNRCQWICLLHLRMGRFSSLTVFSIFPFSPSLG